MPHPSAKPAFPYIFLGTPSAGTWKAGMGVCAVDMAVMSACARVLVKAVGAEGAYTENNRNRIVQMALESSEPVAGIFWCDSDMRFPPNALLRLMSHHKDISGANYRERIPPHRYLGRFRDEADGRRRGLRPMDLLPGGMMLVRLSVYRNLPSPWYRLDEDGLRDDYYFCERAREAGYGIWCDMDLTAEVKHRGDQDIGWYEPGEAMAPREDPRKPPNVGRAEPTGGLALSARESVK